LAEHELPNLFAPFFRGNGRRSGNDGYGLGLAIARRCVEADGGTIRADHRPGGGLCVEIVLPLPGARLQAGGGPS
jgi:two-component system OmpR family sensor kinase